MAGFKYLFFISLLVCAACENEGPPANGYVDQEFATLCEAFEAVSRFALNVHVERTADEYGQIRKETPLRMAEWYNVDPPQATTDQCNDIESFKSKKDLSDVELYRVATGAFISLLDPHSDYQNEEGHAQYNKIMENRNRSLGMTFSNWVPWAPRRKVVPEHLIVEEVFYSSRTSDSIRPEDTIVSVNAIPLPSMDGDKLFDELYSGDEVMLELEDGRIVKVSAGEYRSEPVSCKTITVHGFLMEYIRIRIFSKETAALLQDCMKQAKDSNVVAIVVDLRNNPGGDAIETTLAASNFSPGASVLEFRGDDKKNSGQFLKFDPNGAFKKNVGGAKPKLPVFVLLDQGSASGAELFAALLHGDNFFTVGDRPFGKATGQAPLLLSKRNKIGGWAYVTLNRLYVNRFNPQGSNHLQTDLKVPSNRRLWERFREENVPFVEEDYVFLRGNVRQQIVSPDTRVGKSESAKHEEAVGHLREAISPSHFEEICRNAKDCALEITYAYAAEACRSL